MPYSILSESSGEETEFCGWHLGGRLAEHFSSPEARLKRCFSLNEIEMTDLLKNHFQTGIKTRQQGLYLPIKRAQENNDSVFGYFKKFSRLRAQLRRDKWFFERCPAPPRRKVNFPKIWGLLGFPVLWNFRIFPSITDRKRSRVQTCPFLSFLHQIEGDHNDGSAEKSIGSLFALFSLLFYAQSRGIASSGR